MQDAPTRKVPPEEVRRVRVADGTSLRAIVRPGSSSATPFLLVHGLASNARLWGGVAAELAAAGIPSAAVDLRGHGESAKVDHGFDFATLADDLRSIVEALFGRPVVAAGQSWGGNVVVEMAARHPASVAGVVCVDGGFLRLPEVFPDWETAAATLRPPPLAGTPRPELEALIRSHLDGFPEEGKAAQLANFETMADGTVRPRLTLERHMTILRHLWEHDPDAVASRLDAAVLVVAAHDTALPGKEERVAAFARSLRRGRVVWLDAHHDVHAQRPTEVAALLIEFDRGLGVRM